MKPLPLDRWDDSLRHVIDDMQGRPLNIHALMANHPRLLNAWWDLRMYLVNGGDLEQRQCELVILRVAVHMHSWYEWASHVVRGIDSGLAPDEIEKIRSGSGDWDDADAVLLQAVDEIIRAHAISAATRDRLAGHFTGRQVMDVIFLHGMYTSIACMIGTWGLELDEHVQARLPDSTTQDAF
jgi:4-carboxymuconolactone decarboxylase